MEPASDSPLKKNVLQTKVEGAGGSHHSYSEEELRIFTTLINHILAGDEDLKTKLPINADSTDLFTAVGDGILLCKLINKATPNTIDRRALNLKHPLNIFQIKENLNLAIQSAKSIGCKVVSIFPESIIEKREHLILGLSWQILKIQVLSMINLKEHPYLIRLLKEGEELSDFKKLPPEDILLRWFNYHLANAKHERKVNNFEGDVKDGVNYTVLLNQLDSNKCDRAPLQLDDTLRCQKIVEYAKKLGVDTILQGRDIQTGNPKINLVFTSLIFNHCPGLTAQEEDYKAAGLLEEEGDPNDSREERAFRMWANSLNLDGVSVQNLYEDSRDGLVILKILERILPAGSVDWKKASLQPNHKLKKIQNCNYAIEVAKNAGFKMIAVGGIDIHDGKKKMCLALVWQMVRKHTVDTLGGTTEEKLLEWANSRIPEGLKIASFKDASIKTSKPLFEILKSIEPRAVDSEYTTEGSTPEEIEANAKYVISVARRIGATTFLVWEDIRDAKQNMIFTFVASLAKVASGESKEAMPELATR